MDLSWITLRRFALAMPLVFAAHGFEEAVGGFFLWFNDRVEPDLSWNKFMAVGFTALAISTFVGAFLADKRNRAMATIASAWVGFLMLGNGIAHITAAIVEVDWVPGLATAAILYLPYSLLLYAAIVVECAQPVWRIALAALLGAFPMFIQGWLVIFEGESLI